MKMTSRLATAIAAATLFLMFLCHAVVMLVWSDLSASERWLVGSVLRPRFGLMLFALLAGAVIAAVIIRRVYAVYVEAPQRVLEHAEILLRSDGGKHLEEAGSPETRALIRVINGMTGQLQALRNNIDNRVRQAAQCVETEKNRLAALVSELTQSVVVCNLDGRILLYNNQARLQFRALSETPTAADGGELIGLGRSIYTVFDRNLISHALETICLRVRDGTAPATRFVMTARCGLLLRVHMTAVLSSPESNGDRRVTGFILMLEDVTDDFENELQRDQMLYALTEGSRGALANIRIAADMLGYPDLEDALRKRFLAVIRDETAAMSERLNRTADEFANALKVRWPLEEMQGTDLVEAARRHIDRHLGIPTKLEEDTDTALWVRVDSFSVVQALTYLVSRLSDEFNVREVRFRLKAAEQRVHLDLIWSGQAMSTETVMGWELESMSVAGENSPLSVRDIIERHNGEIWLEREKVRHRAFFRILLPAAQPRRSEPALFLRAEGRPEYYDFDLFKWSEKTQGWTERRLSELSYTVFDTETTGLHPSEGDEIIQIGAIRIFNGRLLRHESFEQLIDPQCPLSPESVRIHGIAPEMLRDQPSIGKVLPVFHAFAADTVLVAHNAAFDMRFLQIKEATTGLCFDQPVLDTLLLSAILHPHQASHSLEAIAERLNVSVAGRHTAIGDAIVTAEIFLKMLPLLAEKGIHTLGEACAAAEKSYYARLCY